MLIGPLKGYTPGFIVVQNGISRRPAVRFDFWLPAVELYSMLSRCISTPLALALLAALAPSPAAAQQADPALTGPCKTDPGLYVLTSPRRPFIKEALRVLVVSGQPLAGARLRGKGPGGELTLKVMQRGGPPYWWLARVERPVTGRHRFVLTDAAGKVLACQRTRVRARRPDPPALGAAAQWPVKRRWGSKMEHAYSAWIERLFDAPPTERPSWTPLHVVIRDPMRNLLYNHLGTDEDGPRARAAVVLKPDCADLPFFLRGYFAWKMRLPFAWRHCSRGSSKRPPKCGEPHTIRTVAPVTGKRYSTPAKRFSYFARRHVGLVHSGCGRTAPGDDATDLYPVKLNRASLRPGTVYVDPYGHLLIVAKWVNQTATSSGQLFAVDGHPDLSVGRKRFWRGAFLFSDNIRGAAGGFKRFRPVVRQDAQLVPLTNKEINAHRDYGDQSDEQYKLGVGGFYDRMDRIINPRPLSAAKLYGERLKALHELILERVDSVTAGEGYMRKQRYKVMKMPSGPRIFETRGPWEDFSTPARDFRLLIAMDEVVGFPAKVQAAPSRYVLPAGQTPAQARKQLEALLASFTAAHKLSYVKSDGATQTLTMAALLLRAKGLELAYNPNDCVELRWAASGDELKTCKRRAPAAQRKLMTRFRPWFATRNRPPIR